MELKYQKSKAFRARNQNSDKLQKEMRREINKKMSVRKNLKGITFKLTTRSCLKMDAALTEAFKTILEVIRWVRCSHYSGSTAA